MKKRKWNGQSSVPQGQWGRDHWSLLVYIETRAVDYSGKIAAKHLRGDGDKYPTKLKDSELQGHSDWNCIDDLETAELVINKGTGINPIFHLTDEGWKQVGLERRRRAERNA